MAASDHLEPKLFHGTGHWFAPGEIVEPGRRDIYRSYKRKAGAYATTDMEGAKSYAWRQAMGASTPDSKPHQFALFAPVYEVEHMSEHSDPLNIFRGKKDVRRDEVGFRPVRIAGYANWND